MSTYIPPVENYDFSIPCDTKENEINALPNAIKTLLKEEYKYVNNFKTIQIQGGITNRLYRLEPLDNGDNNDEKKPKSVIIRIYGDNTELLINRKNDIENFKEMSRLNFGVRLLGLFNNGRIEEDFYNSITLEPADLAKPMYSKIIAKMLCKMNSLPIQADGQEVKVKEPILFKTLYEWLNVAESIDWCDDVDKKERFEKKMNLNHCLRKEIEWLSTLLNNTKSPIVFAHNDLLSGNILYRDEDTTLVFVDYEYGGWNYRGFDIGNHFCEYAGFDYSQFDQVYPDKNCQFCFLTSYIETEYKIKHQDDENVDNNCKTFLESAEFETYLNKLYVEANRYALAAHLFWGVWGVIQARHSKIDFDFLKYGEERIAAYYFSKKKLEKDGLI